MSKSTAKIIRSITRQKGFTLIEMIGVLAIIAVLVAAVAPRIFKSVSDSKMNNMAMAVKGVQTALAEYFKDVNVITAIDATGSAVASDAAGTLLPAMLTRPKNASDNVGLLTRFEGPYLDKFDASAPPIGTGMTLPYGAAAAAGTALAAGDGVTWDLDGNGTHDLNAAHISAYVQVADVTQDDFDKIDKMLDPGIGSTDAERQARGKVKWAANTMRMLVQYK